MLAGLSVTTLRRGTASLVDIAHAEPLVNHFNGLCNFFQKTTGNCPVNHQEVAA
jgi:hypothetical protein